MEKLTIYSNGYAQVSLMKNPDVSINTPYAIDLEIVPTIISSTVNACGESTSGTLVPLQVTIRDPETFLDTNINPHMVTITDKNGVDTKGYLISNTNTTAFITSKDKKTQIFISDFNKIVCSDTEYKRAKLTVNLIPSKIPLLRASYLASGISWTSAYMFTVSPVDPKTGFVSLVLIVRAIITNNTGSTLKPRKLYLVTGNVYPPTAVQISNTKYMSNNRSSRSMAMARSVPRMTEDSSDVSESMDINEGASSVQSVTIPPELGVSTQIHLDTIQNIKARMIHKIDIPRYSTQQYSGTGTTNHGFTRINFGYRFDAPKTLTSGQACFYQSEEHDFIGTFIGGSHLPQVSKSQSVDLMVGTNENLQYSTNISINTTSVKPSNISDSISSRSIKMQHVIVSVTITFANPKENFKKVIMSRGDVYPNDKSNNLKITFAKSSIVIAEKNLNNGDIEWEFDIVKDNQQIRISVEYDEELDY